MAPRAEYRTQAELLIRCLPAVASAPDFALKGGTAINLFLRNMPRLSVDIDLTYLPISDRNTALMGIRAFAGMTDPPIELAELEAARTRLFDWVATALTEGERRFLLSIKQGEPDWTRLPFKGLDRWPAIQWKLYNIRRMSPRRHKKALGRLQDVLQM
ncbi:MAG: nucleotidyl transferase AbiEii/AbiGii toxin family protein [Gammaproteobacteria bacterium]|nr:nucleotidyl transferase AbiEii/AbiGii toxin family protein [Gammaproteobacteria bacterium]